MKNQYDLDSAITFFLVGLGIGSVLTIVFNPKARLRLERPRQSGVGVMQRCQDKSTLKNA